MEYPINFLGGGARVFSIFPEDILHPCVLRFVCGSFPGTARKVSSGFARPSPGLSQSRTPDIGVIPFVPFSALNAEVVEEPDSGDKKVLHEHQNMERGQWAQEDCSLADVRSSTEGEGD